MDIKDFSISRALPAPSSTTMFTIRVNGSHRAGASEGYRKLKDQGGNLTTAGKTQKGGSLQTGFGEGRHLQVYPDRLGRGSGALGMVRSWCAPPWSLMNSCVHGMALVPQPG